MAVSGFKSDAHDSVPPPKGNDRWPLHSSTGSHSAPRFAPLRINKDSMEQKHYFFTCVCALHPTCSSHGAMEAIALSGSGHILYPRDPQQGWLDFLAGSGKEVREFESKAGNDRKVPGEIIKDAEDRTAFHISIAKRLFEMSVSLT